MRRSIVIIFILLLTASDVLCQDYYSNKSLIKGTENSYKVTTKDYEWCMSVHLENTTNVFSGRYPYDNVAQKFYSEAYHPMPIAYPNEKILNDIKSAVFSTAELDKYFSEDCCMFINFRVDPLTGHAKEISFGLDYVSDDKRILSLPISKIEQLEAALKKNLLFHVPEDGKNADFLLISGRVF